MTQDGNTKDESAEPTREEAPERRQRQMLEEAKAWQENHPLPKRGMSDFQKAMMWTAISAVVLSAVGILAGIVAAVVFAIKGKRQIVSGILAGLGIGIVAIGVSCFAIIAVVTQSL